MSEAVASAAFSENFSDHLVTAARIGAAVGDRCSADLARRDAIPSWMNVASLRAQISSIMWTPASEGLKLGKTPDDLENILSEVFLTLVENMPSDLDEPSYARLPEGISVALSEQKNMAEKIIPQLMVMERDKNHRFYIAQSGDFAAWLLKMIRKSALELSAAIDGKDKKRDEQTIIVYQSIFGSAATLACSSLKVAAQQVFASITQDLKSGKKPKPADTQRQYARQVRRNFEDGVGLLRDAVSRDETKDLEQDLKPASAGVPA